MKSIAQTGMVLFFVICDVYSVNIILQNSVNCNHFQDMQNNINNALYNG